MQAHLLGRGGHGDAKYQTRPHRRPWHDLQLEESPSGANACSAQELLAVMYPRPQYEGNMGVRLRGIRACDDGENDVEREPGAPVPRVLRAL